MEGGTEGGAIMSFHDIENFICIDGLTDNDASSADSQMTK
jgi:hypothetical protein